MRARMKLRELLERGTSKAVGDAEVRGVAYDSREVCEGDVFFALRGARADGGAFAGAAIAKGAVAVVGEGAPDPGLEARFIRVPDARRELAIASHRFYGDPSSRIRLAAITGTAGKTTTSFLLDAMLRAAGLSTGLVGTVVYRFAGHEEPAALTSPQSTDLARLLREMADAGVQAATMEVTSHALAQHRATGCRFEAAAFTNMSREHLDFHDDMEDYFAAKKRLFTDFDLEERCAFNTDDPWATRARKELGGRGIGFGLAVRADVTARAMRFDAAGIRAQIRTPRGSFEVASPLMGQINLMNMLAAASLAHLMGLHVDAMAEGIRALRGVPGRMENVGRELGRRVIVDFSHKVDALERVLGIARALTPRGGRVFVVLGCGGERDQGKRPLMGRTAVEGADVVVLTSDNPRSEAPLAILAQIESGIRDTGSKRFSGGVPSGSGHYAILEDRAAAIRLAVRAAGPDDTVLICGKGHQTQQIVGETVRHFDDREEAKRALLGG